MRNVDIFSKELLEEAKRFFEKAKSETNSQGKNAYFHASLLVAFAALEAHINSIAADFDDRKEFHLLEKSMLFEKQIRYEGGEFELINNFKMYRLEDRIELIFKKFSGKSVKKNEIWMKLKQGIRLRNKLIHPREKELITENVVENSILAILAILNDIYKVVYKCGYPLRKRGISSSLTF